MKIILSLLVLVLVTNRCSGQSSLTCADTVQGKLKPVVNCTYNESLVVCGDFDVPPDYEVPNVTTFKILEQVNISQNIIKFCLGLIHFTRDNVIITENYLITQQVGFNSSLAVGILTVNRNCWETQRSSECLIDVTILQEVLELGIFKYFPRNKEFWNFNSPLFGLTLGWFQTLEVHVTKGRYFLVTADWIENLQNSSIRYLKVTCAHCSKKEDGILLKNMPYLFKVDLVLFCIKKFHKDSFTGTPNLEHLVLPKCRLKNFPDVIARLPKLKTLDLSFNKIVDFDFIRDKTLPFLHNLESLTINEIRINPVLDKFPVLPNLKSLTLSRNNLQTLEKDAFRNISFVEILDLNDNKISNIENDTFLSLRKLKMLDLRNNLLNSWPVLYFCSLRLLDLSWNNLTELMNPSVTGTTIDSVDLVENKISNWNDVNIFSYNYNIAVQDHNLIQTNSSQSFTSVYKNNDYKTFKHNFLSNSVSEKDSMNPKLMNKEYYSNNYSLENTYSDTNALKSKNSPKQWVKILNLSSNLISRFTDNMIESMDGLEMVVLGSNPYDCGDCTLPQFQKWINKTKTVIRGILFIRCYEPVIYQDTLVIDVEFDLEACMVKGTNYWIVAGIPLGIGLSIFIIITSIYFRFRSQIIYMLHLYKIRKQKSSAKNRKCKFDAFVCYSSRDRRFVLKVLVPFLESCPERFKLCFHERDFVLGSHIIDNVVEAIDQSRKTIIILSPHFINSKWCKWELEMANQKMFEDDQQFLIIIQVTHMDRDIIPRYLRFFMDTRTFLLWTEDISESSEKDLCKELKESMGKSIFQNFSEQTPIVDVSIET